MDLPTPPQAARRALADFLAKKKAKVSLTARPAIDTAELNDVYVRMLRAATSGRMSDEVWRTALRDAAALPGADLVQGLSLLERLAGSLECLSQFRKLRTAARDVLARLVHATHSIRELLVQALR